MSALVMSGDFKTFSFEEVLEVVGLSRQQMVITVSDAQSSALGKIVIKAGKVLDAHSTKAGKGKGALLELMARPGHSFEVHRLQHSANLATAQPIGALGALIEEFKERAREIVPMIGPGNTQQIESQIKELMGELRGLVGQNQSTVTGRLDELDKKMALLSTSNSVDERLGAIESAIASPKASALEWAALGGICLIQLATLLVLVFLLGAQS